MSQVSRPVQIALVATLLLAVVWFVALRPKPADGGGAAAVPAAQETPAAPGTAGLTGAVDQAEDAVATADADAQRAGQSSAEADTPAKPAPAAADAAESAKPAAAAPRRAARAAGAEAAREVNGPVASVRAALRQHKALAIAFVDPATADARAVGQELRQVSHFDGRAFTLPVSLARLSDYAFITRNVQVTVAPTVVIVAPDHTATTIVGFTDRGEIEQGLADALASKRD